MKDRIDNLLSDARLDYLMATSEFATARGRLAVMLEKLKDKKRLSQADKKYIAGAEKHIKNIKPRIKNILVNGEYVDVMFLTETA